MKLPIWTYAGPAQDPIARSSQEEKRPAYPARFHPTTSEASANAFLPKEDGFLGTLEFHTEADRVGGTA
jgi:hypothetical protein